MFWTLYSNIKDFQNRRFLLQMANMYYVSESVDLNHSSLNLVRHTTFNLASCLISSCYWLRLHQKLYKKHVLYVNCVWIIKGCIKDQSPLSFTHIGECFNELREILYSCNHCQMGKHCS